MFVEWHRSTWGQYNVSEAEGCGWGGPVWAGSQEEAKLKYSFKQIETQLNTEGGDKVL